MLIALCVTLPALLADRLLGEPVRGHPLVAFGRFADSLQRRLNNNTRGAGFVAWLLAVAPLVLVACALQQLQRWPLLYTAVAGGVLYLALGWRSLLLHANAVADALRRDDLSGARQAVAMIVSRDTDNLNTEQVAGAAVESVLENGNDAIFAPLFWFWLGGIPGVVLYRLVNTLDAMWGYKNTRFLFFGWAAARADDLLNWIPARLVAFSYALCGHTSIALDCWRRQAPAWKSPNAGPVMASGAGALQLALGGPSSYGGQWQQRPALGVGNPPGVESIGDAGRLINRTLLLWITALSIWMILSLQ